MQYIYIFDHLIRLEVLDFCIHISSYHPHVLYESQSTFELIRINILTSHYKLSNIGPSPVTLVCNHEPDGFLLVNAFLWGANK